MQRYSLFSLFKNSFDNHRSWQPAWRSHEIQPEYDVVIVGAGGHGLATAYYLAKNHGITNVAVIEKGWLGGGNTGRNTAVIRSNYLRDDSIKFFEKSVQLYEGLGQDLNYNVMFSQRSQVDVLMTSSSMRAMRRRAYNTDLHGVDFDILTPDQVRQRIPAMAPLKEGRLDLVGGTVQERAGIGRHDAIAWGYARGADSRGVHIHENTEVTAIRKGSQGEIIGVETTRGMIKAKKVAIATGGNNHHLGQLAGLDLPLKTFNLQAYVSEPIKPVIDVVVNCPDLGVYLSHSDKGELVIGGSTDAQQQSFRQGGKYPVFEDSVAALLELFPTFKRLKLLRQWGGALEFAEDASPIVSMTDIPGFYVSCGWWGGFKGIPASGYTLAHTIANNAPHALNERYSLNRFKSLDYLLEAGTTVPNR
jgi:sarcosine oxidase subunit beta